LSEYFAEGGKRGAAKVCRKAPQEHCRSLSCAARARGPGDATAALRRHDRRRNRRVLILAPHLTRERVDRAAACEAQAEVDALFEATLLPGR